MKFEPTSMLEGARGTQPILGPGTQE